MLGIMTTLGVVVNYNDQGWIVRAAGVIEAEVSRITLSVESGIPQLRFRTATRPKVSGSN